MAQTFIDAGSDFIICPGLIEEVAQVVDNNNILWIPGCMTPTEIIRAETLGAKMIKLFPGNILGPELMSTIKALFPDLLFMPTGGVDLDKENIAKRLARNGYFKGTKFEGVTLLYFKIQKSIKLADL
jgi:2-dehydro-3-deoxyphosphogluconate aldolase/(4S)-4-hydroxy-2-oxoglutarate aldolase